MGRGALQPSEPHARKSDERSEMFAHLVQVCIHGRTCIHTHRCAAGSPAAALGLPSYPVWLSCSPLLRRRCTLKAQPDRGLLIAPRGKTALLKVCVIGVLRPRTAVCPHVQGRHRSLCTRGFCTRAGDLGAGGPPTFGVCRAMAGRRLCCAILLLQLQNILSNVL